MINIQCITFSQINTPNKYKTLYTTHPTPILKTVVSSFSHNTDCVTDFLLLFFHLGVEFSCVATSRGVTSSSAINNQNLVKVERQWTHSHMQVLQQIKRVKNYTNIYYGELYVSF